MIKKPSSEIPVLIDSTTLLNILLQSGHPSQNFKYSLLKKIIELLLDMPFVMTQLIIWNVVSFHIISHHGLFAER